MIGIVGIVLSLILLMYLAYRDVSVLVLAPLCALLAVTVRWKSAGAGDVHADFHGECRSVCQRLFSLVSAGGHLWQADGRFRRGGEYCGGCRQVLSESIARFWRLSSVVQF